MLATLEDLDEAALVKILTEPKNALVKQYQRLFALEGCELEVQGDALTSIAKKAVERKTGARGLRTILEHALLDTMYEVPSAEPPVAKVVVSGRVIDAGEAPKLIEKEIERQRA